MTIVCSRCGASTDAMPQPPMPGETGRLVHDCVCAGCWREWQANQIILINEYRLNLLDPEVRRALDRQLREFLHLPPA